MLAICVTVSKSTCLIVNNKIYIWFIPAALLTAGIAVISLWEAPQLPPDVMSLGDKVLHGIMYVILAMAWMIPVAHFLPHHPAPYIYVCLAVTAYGMLMEVLQRFCTLTRSGEMEDVYADFVGAMVGVLIIGVWHLLHSTSR